MNSALPSLLAGLALPFTLPYPPVLRSQGSHWAESQDEVGMLMYCTLYSHGVDLFIEDPYLAPLVGVGCPDAG